MIKPTACTTVRREVVEMPLYRAARTGGRCRRSMDYVKPTVGSTARYSEYIGDRSRRVVQGAG